jgi:cyanate lyase
MTRQELTNKIRDSKRGSGLSWKAIAAAIGPGSPVLYTAALLGQMTLTKDEAERAAKVLGLTA